ncbi:protein SOB FIVE-LIKE 1-like isoform X1 [Syzygium oleosum]|uniref:protein SOB FIVE-LIKE 1-like isoform X1 n=2 Tax=Syzygium oleosum TaxID=219896 RepID=UPI0011D24515|nr:protein SOB FIVE-LIKE 1-like isoform X1 [Syzygium oleosum]
MRWAMESSSQASEGSEECLSNESGWTMYIGSPMQEDDEGAGDEQSTHNNDDDDAEDGGHKGDKDGGHGEAESDDSMASDASSRPSYRGCVASKNAAKKGPSKNDYKEEDDDDLKQRADGTDPSPSRGKVSKSLRIKKRK